MCDNGRSTYSRHAGHRRGPSEIAIRWHRSYTTGHTDETGKRSSGEWGAAAIPAPSFVKAHVDIEVRREVPHGTHGCFRIRGLVCDGEFDGTALMRPMPRRARHGR